MSKHLAASVPDRLADAVESRARKTGVSRSDVIRSALVREVTAPEDKMSRACVELWLAGAEFVDTEGT